MTARDRPRTLQSTTTQLATERGNLFVTVCVDDDGRPVEVLGSLGKAGSTRARNGRDRLQAHLAAPSPRHAAVPRSSTSAGELARCSRGQTGCPAAGRSR